MASMRRCRNQIDVDLIRLRRKKTAIADSPHGLLSFELLPPFHPDLVGLVDYYKAAQDLLISVFKANTEVVKDCVYRGQHLGTKGYEPFPLYETCLVACLWLEKQLVSAASLRVDAAHAGEQGKSFVQVIYQATVPKLQRRGLGRLLTCCVLRTASEAGHEYASVMLHSGAAAADFWFKVGFAGPPSSASKDNSSGDGANLAAVVLRSKVWGPGYPVWMAKLPSPKEQPVSSGKGAAGSGSFLMSGFEGFEQAARIVIRERLSSSVSVVTATATTVEAAAAGGTAAVATCADDATPHAAVPIKHELMEYRYPESGRHPIGMHGALQVQVSGQGCGRRLFTSPVLWQAAHGQASTRPLKTIHLNALLRPNKRKHGFCGGVSCSGSASGSRNDGSLHRQPAWGNNQGAGGAQPGGKLRSHPAWEKNKGPGASQSATQDAGTGSQAQMMQSAGRNQWQGDSPGLLPLPRLTLRPSSSAAPTPLSPTATASWTVPSPAAAAAAAGAMAGSYAAVEGGIARPRAAPLEHQTCQRDTAAYPCSRKPAWLVERPLRGWIELQVAEDFAEPSQGENRHSQTPHLISSQRSLQQAHQEQQQVLEATPCKVKEEPLDTARMAPPLLGHPSSSPTAFPEGSAWAVAVAAVHTHAAAASQDLARQVQAVDAARTAAEAFSFAEPCAHCSDAQSAPGIHGSQAVNAGWCNLVCLRCGWPRPHKAVRAAVQVALDQLAQGRALSGLVADLLWGLEERLRELLAASDGVDKTCSAKLVSSPDCTAVAGMHRAGGSGSDCSPRKPHQAVVAIHRTAADLAGDAAALAGPEDADALLGAGPDASLLRNQNGSSLKT